MSNWGTAAYQYMVENIEGHRDRLTGEVNMTTLTEDCQLNCRYPYMRYEDDLSEIAFAVVEVDAGRMTVAENKDWVEKYTGEDQR